MLPEELKSFGTMTVSRHLSDLYLIICTVLHIINGVAETCTPCCYCSSRS